MPNSKDKVTIKIPRPLYDRLKNIIGDSGFSSVNEFVVYVLRDLVSLGFDDDKELTKEETETIKKRLKNLGYF
jgi:metal-responsive CopG/Arc/MetJ family transcriptional regulator